MVVDPSAVEIHMALMATLAAYLRSSSRSTELEAEVQSEEDAALEHGCRSRSSCSSRLAILCVFVVQPPK